MYKEYYGLSADPFRLAADYRNLYSHQSLRKARSYLQYGLEVGEGIILVTGTYGTGKTTLINEVVSNATGLNLDPIIVECTDYSGADLLRHYASILSGEAGSPDIPNALNIITHALLEAKSEGKKSLLILDEAHQLQTDALHKLLLLNNLRASGEQLVQIFLVGHSSLRSTILLPELEHLHQRLVATCKIIPMTKGETEEYVKYNLAAADWNGTPELDARAFGAIHKTSMGNPRWINLICSRLLLHGMINQKDNLGLPDVCEVLRDLLNEDLLPAPVRRLNTAKSTSLKAA